MYFTGQNKTLKIPSRAEIQTAMRPPFPPVFFSELLRKRFGAKISRRVPPLKMITWKKYITDC